METKKFLLSEWSKKTIDEKIKRFANNFDFLKFDVLELIKKNPKDFKFIIRLYKTLEFVDNNPPRHIIWQVTDLTSEIYRAIINQTDFETVNKLSEMIKSGDTPKFIRFLFYSPEDLSHLSDDRNITTLLMGINNLFAPTALARALKINTEHYPDDWHFFFELVQNARDAGSDKVKMKKVEISEGKRLLIFANNGKQFSPLDIWGVTSLGQGIKRKADSIGYFGIGFKSVNVISDTAIIISKPFQIRINFNIGVERKKYIEWAFQDEDKWKYLENKGIFSKFTNFGNQFLLEDIPNEKFKKFDKYIEDLNQNFMLFLDPLREIKVFEKKFKSELKNEIFNLEKTQFEERFPNTNIIKIQEDLFITHTLNEEVGLKDDKGIDIGVREVQIALKMIEIDSNHFKIIKHGTKQDLYAYFPVTNLNPGFKFIFQGHFLVTPTRAELELKESKEWKKDLNVKLIRELGVRCFLELFQQLSKSTILFENLDTIIPYEKLSNEKKSEEKEIYNYFRLGLQNYLRKSEFQTLPFWWDSETKKYIPLQDVILVQEPISSEILKFLHKHLKDQFIDIISKIFNKDFEDDIYICDNERKIRFCEEFFEDFNEKLITSNKTKEIIIEVLSSLDSHFVSGFISFQEWNGYFDSEHLLKDFRTLLIKWDYLKSPEVRSQIFKHFLLVLEGCEGESYYAKANFDNYYYIEEDFLTEFREFYDILQDLNNLPPKKRVNVPLFIPNDYEPEYRDENNPFYKCKISSLFNLLDIDNFSTILEEESEIFSLFLQIIKRSIQKLKNAIESKSGRTGKVGHIFNLISQQGQEKFSEANMFKSIFLKFLELPIYPGTVSNDKFFDLFWGQEQYIKLISKTQFNNFFNIIKPELYTFSNLIMDILKKYVFPRVKLEFSKYASRIKIKNLSFFTIQEMFNTLNDLIDKKTINEIKVKFNSLELIEKIKNVHLLFFSSVVTFESFTKSFYLEDQRRGEPKEIIFLSRFYSPPKFQILKIKDEFTGFPIIELQEEVTEEILNLFINLFKNIKGKHCNWIHKDDLTILKENSYIRDIDKKNVFNLIQDSLRIIIEKNSSIEIWLDFYKLLNSHYSNLEPIKGRNFKNSFKTLLNQSQLKLRFINKEGDIFEVNRLYPKTNFEGYPTNFEIIANHSKYQKYRVALEYIEIWNSLSENGLIPNKLNDKKFIKIVLDSFDNFQEFYLSLFPEQEKREKLPLIKFYSSFLEILKFSNFKLKGISSYKLIPNLKLDFLPIKEISHYYNILFLDDNFKTFPYIEISEEFPEFNEKSHLFEDWINPEYFNIFQNTFEINLTDSSEAGINLSKWLLNPDIKKDQGFEDLPISLNLFLIEYYFRKKKLFDIKNDLEILKNALGFLIYESSSDEEKLRYFISILEEQKQISRKEAGREFVDTISSYSIFPHYAKNKWLLTNLLNPNLHYSKTQIPPFFSKHVPKAKYIILQNEIEDLLFKSQLKFNFLEAGHLPSIKLILRHFKNLFDSNNENFNQEDHCTIVKFLFQYSNFKFYASKENSKNFKDLLKILYVKGINNKFELVTNLFNPIFYFKHFIYWWDMLITPNKEIFQSSQIISTVDLKFYKLEKKAFEYSASIEKLQIFIPKLDRIEVLQHIINILNENIDKIDPIQDVYEKFCKNLVKFLKDPYFEEQERPNTEKLGILIKDTLRVIFRKFISENPELSEKFLLTKHQYEYCYTFFEEDLVFIIDKNEFFRPIHDLINNITQFIDVDISFIYDFFEDEKFFKTIKSSLNLDYISNHIMNAEDNSRLHVEALNFILEEQEYKTLYCDQKNLEFKLQFQKLRSELKWIRINKKLYSLNELFLKNKELIFRINILKNHAYFDDFCIENRLNVQNLGNFIEFFELKKIQIEALMDYLQHISIYPIQNKKPIIQLLKFLTNQENIDKTIKIIRKLKIIPGIEIKNQQNLNFYALEDLIKNDFVFLSSKRLIIDEFINKWNSALELKKRNPIILFDNKDLDIIISWKKIMKEMLRALDSELILTSIEKYPKPMGYNLQLEPKESSKQYIEEIKFLKTILTYINKVGTENTLKPLQLNEMDIESLEHDYAFKEVPKIISNILVPNFINKEKKLSDVEISRFFRIQEDYSVLHSGLPPSWLEEEFFTELYEKIFPKGNKSENLIKNELEVFNKIRKWYKDRSIFMDPKGNYNYNEMRDYLIKLQNLELKDYIASEDNIQSDFLDSVNYQIERIIKSLETTNENSLFPVSRDEILNFLKFLIKNLTIKTDKLIIPFTKVNLEIDKLWI